MTITCPYCTNHSRLTDGTEIYPHRPDLAEKKFYYCKPCDAFTGCHKGTETPLGTLANKPTRKARTAAADLPPDRRRAFEQHLENKIDEETSGEETSQEADSGSHPAGD